MSPERECKSSRMDLFSLPQPLLELLLVSYTGTRDKKALRLTCKHFQQTLDDCLVSTRLRSGSEDSITCLEKFLKRMRHSHAFKAVYITNGPVDHRVINNLPYQMTTLTLDAPLEIVLNLQGLTVLHCLNALKIPGSTTVTGLGYVSGLTRLHAHSPVGSVAHLAPTLKHLDINHFKHVRDFQKLTNLEVLVKDWALPPSFFAAHTQLAVKHFCVRCHYHSALSLQREHAQAWTPAPTTLTKLTINGSYFDVPRVLPGSITHLQLLHVKEFRNAEEIAAAVPGLMSLDLLIRTCQHDGLNHCVELKQLSQLTNLETLNVCFINDSTGQRAVLQPSLAVELAELTKLGVKVHVVTNPDELRLVAHGPFTYEAVWATHAR